MLPESLSSVACSLTPREDRFAMVVAMDIDYKGGSKPHWMGPALINSKARLDYELVARLLSGEPAVRKELGEPITSQVFRLKDLTDLLLGKRRRRGMLELSTAEPKVVLAPGEELKVDDVVRQKHSKWVQKAYGLVEQCMLEANETVGAYMDACGAAVPWRIHPEADGEKLERFAELLKLLGREKLAREIDASKPSFKGARQSRAAVERPPAVGGRGVEPLSSYLSHAGHV